MSEAQKIDLCYEIDKIFLEEIQAQYELSILEWTLDELDRIIIELDSQSIQGQIQIDERF